MPAAVPTTQESDWLTEQGPKELEKLFRAVVFQSASAVLLTADDTRYCEASGGAARLFGVPSNQLEGHHLAEFVHPDHRLLVPESWKCFLDQGEQSGTLHLLAQDGRTREVEYFAKANVLPSRHLLSLHDDARAPHAAKIGGSTGDFAFYLLDSCGSINVWYLGATRLYGYSAEEVIGREESILHQPSDNLVAQLEVNFDRAINLGHAGSECWHRRRDGTLFWANAITMALKDHDGNLQGFACIVRDFSHRRDADNKRHDERQRLRLVSGQTGIACIVSGEYDRILDANDSFLEMLGYSRDEILSESFSWPRLTPDHAAHLDELAHEECLRFNACTPYEKEMVAKGGGFIPVLVVTAVLSLSPYHWVSFIQDLRERNRYERVDFIDSAASSSFSEIVGSSPAIRRVQQQVEVVAPTDATVLILGETGTGKELIARAIHRLSKRSNAPFITLNCAAIPTGLLESELFGYERGAFTGAVGQKVGRFELANQGTLFLDEVGDIPLDLQPKLLRALQEKSLERLGGVRNIPIDVRLVAATNRNLTEMMQDKLFRSDLYYRLKVFPITSPPLRDRPEDIPMLVRHFVRKYSEKMGRHIETIPVDIMQAIVRGHWPGNVRELENFIERSVILSVGSHLRAPVSEIRNVISEPLASSHLDYVEREHILNILRQCNGVVTTAATRLGLHRTTLNALMRRLGISRKDV